MTRRALPKPVEAWGVLALDGSCILSKRSFPSEAEMPAIYYDKECAESDYRVFIGAQHPVIRVRIVPITPKKRTTKKRKEKKK